MAGHQPKELTELAFASFTAFMKDTALQLLNWMKVSPTSTDEATETCRELKDFFHGTRLPPVLANEITKRLLRKLDVFYKIYEKTRKNSFQQILLPLVEIFMHPDVTSIELGPGYLRRCDYDYCNFIVTLILMNVGSLRNLKTLSVGFNIDLKGVTLVFPSQLKELTLNGTLFSRNGNLKSIAKCCRELKSFKILGCSVYHISVPDILKLNLLETLHLLYEPKRRGRGHKKIKRGKLEALINEISTDTTSDVLSASTLKSFGIFLTEESSLRLIVDKLPLLTKIVLQLENDFDLSCLTQLKNLRSLTLDARHRASDGYKKILPVLGKCLVFLDLRGYRSLDLEFIGETCSNLRCLHVCTDESFDFETSRKPSLKTFPNLRTVECLRVNMYRDFDWVEFLIVQCVNIKVLSVVNARSPTVIENVLKRTSLPNLKEIHWYPEVRTDKTCLEELCLKCPNLRLLHGLGFDSFTSERVVFDLYECDKGLCKSSNWLLCISDFSHLC